MAVGSHPRAGFTLIELMITVAIIGILAAVAIPAFQKVQCKAKQTEAKMLMTTMIKGVQAYMGEYGNIPGVIHHPSCNILQTVNQALTSYGGVDPRTFSGTKYYTAMYGTSNCISTFLTHYEMTVIDSKQKVNTSGFFDIWTLNVKTFGVSHNNDSCQ